MQEFLWALGITAVVFGLFAVLAILLARSGAASSNSVSFTHNTLSSLNNPEGMVPVSNPPHEKTDSL